jgi:hypothetical protein
MPSFTANFSAKSSVLDMMVELAGELSKVGWGNTSQSTRRVFFIKYLSPCRGKWHAPVGVWQMPSFTANFSAKSSVLDMMVELGWGTLQSWLGQHISIDKECLFLNYRCPNQH